MSRLIAYPTLDEYERKMPDFADRLSNLNADVLKKMARVWAGKDAAKLNREGAVQLLKRSLRDPKAIRQLAENLTAAERDGLMLMKLRERPVVYTEELSLELALLHPLPIGRHFGYYSDNKVHYQRLNEMIERGLLMRCDGGKGGIGDSYSYHACEAVGIVADCFDLIEITPPPALPIKPVTDVAAPVTRSLGELMLQLAAFEQAFAHLEAVQLTAKGLYANPSLNKLYKLLGWNRQSAEQIEDGNAPVQLPSAEFYLGLFIAADLLKVNYVTREVVANPLQDIRAFLEEPADLQAQLWARAYCSLRRWAEYVPRRVFFYDDDNSIGQTKYNGLRAALALALGMLPDPAAWYSVNDLSEAMRLRIGKHFALGYLTTYSAPWKATPEQEVTARAKHEAETLASWQGSEQVWIGRALTGPLFHLGLVELARAPKDKPGELTLFRLTETGRAALHAVFRPTAGKPSHTRPAEQPCWIVQPNFEAIVYLDQATPRQIGFIERIGVRQKSDAAIATYRLTRESIYSALEDGVDAKQLLQKLESGSQHPLPPGVERTLSDWAARRDRLTVRFNASVIEFKDAAERDAAIKAGKVKGAVIGERFILTEEKEPTFRRVLPLGGIVSYEPQPPRSLTVKDDGTVLILPGKRDLLIAGELSAYAETGDTASLWRITQKSVLAARDRGWTADDIINRISQRSMLIPPPFLQYAIKGWCGNKTTPGPTALGTPPLLQTSTAEVAEAICKCSFLRPHLLARIGACSVLVKPESVKALGKLLSEYGFAVGKEVLLPAPPPEKKK